MTQQHHFQDLITIFAQTFFQQYQTKLVKGDDEPLYLPANSQTQYHQIIFANGYYASALHEISHWLVAGEQRRQREDYGYWYCPDGRDAVTQAEFEQVEIKPQAIEWALSTAAGFSFKVSCDNLNGDYEPDRMAFKAKIAKQIAHYIEHGFNLRTQQLLHNIARFYHQSYPLTKSQFEIEPC